METGERIDSKYTNIEKSHKFCIYISEAWMGETRFSVVNTERARTSIAGHQSISYDELWRLCGTRYQKQNV